MFKKTLLSVLVFSTFLFAGNRITEFNVGLLSPTDAERGFYGGLNMGRMVDENVGVSMGFNVYRSSYTKKSTIGEKDQSGQIGISTQQYELDQSATAIPLFFQLHYIGQITPSLDLKVTGGIGYELLWNSITNFKTGQDDTQFFSGFAWQLGAGVSIPISRAADFYGEAFYHGGKPSQDGGETVEGLPVISEVNLNGFGIRVGVRLYGFGF